MAIRDRLTAMLQRGMPVTVEAGDGPVAAGNDISRSKPPKDDYHRFRRQYRTDALVAAALDLRATEIVRPGYRAEADDEDDQDKLVEWASQAALYSGTRDGDLLPLLWQIARDRDLDGTVLVEHVWDDPGEQDSLAGVKQFDPGQTDFLTPANSALLFPPDVEGAPRDDGGNPITPDERTQAGNVPAFVQYPDNWGFDEDSVYLSQLDVTKLTRAPGFGDDRAPASVPDATDFGPNRGVSLVESVSDEVERVGARMQDYNASIASHAYPRLVAEFEDFQRGEGANAEVVKWDRERVASYMGKLTRSEDEKRYQLDGDWTDPGGSVGSPPGVEVRLDEGTVPDIVDSLHYSVDYILSGLRVPKAMVGFGDDINRDITSDQREVFEQDVLQARRQIEREFLTPLFRMKAREIRGDGPFDDSVDVDDVRGRLEPEKAENPLKDDAFDAAEFKTMMEGVATLMDSAAEVHLEDLPGLLEELINMDLEEYARNADGLDDVQEAMGPLDDGVDPDVAEADD